MIIAENLCREFDVTKKKVTAIDHLTIHIPEGEIVGIVGENGAGKTTWMRLVSGLLAPTSGYLKTMRETPMNMGTVQRGKLGVLFGKLSRLQDKMTIADSFDLERQMYSIHPELYHKKLDELYDTLKLSQIWNAYPKEMSLGERMRADLGLLLIRDVRLLVLDEVFLGLDIAIKNTVISYLQKLSINNGTTILFTSHDMQEVKNLCHRLLILEKGRKRYYGSVEIAVKQFQTKRRLKMEFIGKLPDLSDLPVVCYTCTEHSICIDFDSEQIPVQMVLNHIMEQTQVKFFRTTQGGLEEAMQSLGKNREVPDMEE